MRHGERGEELGPKKKGKNSMMIPMTLKIQKIQNKSTIANNNNINISQGITFYSVVVVVVEMWLWVVYS